VTSPIVTLLFTDLVGSTDLYQRLGDVAAEELRRRHFRALRDAVTSLGGQEVKNLGDGLMVVFESPTDAVGCAVAIQQAVHRQNRGGQGELSVRVGLHVGEPIRDEDDYFGTPVTVARRLCDSADGGQIFASELVRGLVGPRGTFEFHSLGAIPLKGLSEPAPAFEVVWAPTKGSRIPLPPFFEGVDRLSLVGRETELEQIRTAFKEAAEGRPQLVLVAGEPGIGKTRLATEFVRGAHADGATVLLGRCDEEPLAAYQPIAEALTRYVATATVDELRANTGRHAPTLAQHLPQLRERIPGLPEAVSGDPETERIRFFEAVSEVLRGIAQDAPLVLMFDDVHWAQQPTLLLLRHLIRESEQAAMLIIATYRETELSRTHPLSDTLAELRRHEDGVVRVGLRGLDRGGVEAFMEAASGADLEEDGLALARELSLVTEGNPFFLREILRHLAETGALIQQEGGRWRSSRPASEIGLPEGVKEVVGRRLSLLSDDSNKALRAAAVIGREFDLSLLRDVLEVDEDALLALVEEGVESRAISEVPRVLDRFTFTHALVRETLLDELTTSRRVRLHRSVGEALERKYASDLESNLPLLAFHFGEAAEADPVKAIDYAMRAGDRAQSMYSYEESAQHFERALEWSEADAPDDFALRCRVLVGLGRAQSRCIGVSTARATLRKAVEPARGLANPVLFADIVLAFSGRYGEPGKADEETVALLEEAMNSLGPDHQKLRTMVKARLAGEYMLVDAQRAYALAEEALAEANALDDPEVQGAGLWAYAWCVSAMTPSVEKWLRLGEDMTHIGRQCGDGWFAAMGWWFKMHAHFIEGDMDAARQAFATYVHETDELHVLQGRFFEQLILGMFATFEGRVADADQHVHAALAAGQVIEDPMATNQFGVQLFGLRLIQGRPGEIEPMLRSLAEVDPNIPWWAALCLTNCMIGHFDEAREVLNFHLSHGLDSVTRDANFYASIGALTYSAWFLNDDTYAEELHEILTPFDGLNVVVGIPCLLLASGAQHLAMLEALLGRWDDYERHIQAASDMNKRTGAITWELLLRGQMGVDLLRRGRPGDADKAQELIASAIAEGEAAGLGLASLLRPLIEQITSV
jgi:class 3 adenylate cyclase/tetratricopeptide (TPR) repeat protein